MLTRAALRCPTVGRRKLARLGMLQKPFRKQHRVAHSFSVFPGAPKAAHLRSTTTKQPHQGITMSKEIKGPVLNRSQKDRREQTEEPAMVYLDLTTGAVCSDGVKRTRVREVPQPNVVIDGGIEKDTPAQPIR